MHLGPIAYSFRHTTSTAHTPASNEQKQHKIVSGEEEDLTATIPIDDVCDIEFDQNDNIVGESCVMREALLTARLEREKMRTELAGGMLQDCFSMLTTTSPNAVILASLDATRSQMGMEGLSMVQTAAAAADEIRYEIRQQNLLKMESISESSPDDTIDSSNTNRILIGGVQLLDDSDSIHAVRKVPNFDDRDHSSPSMEYSAAPEWLIDPLRLTVRFPGRSALDVDDKMCEGKGEGTFDFSQPSSLHACYRPFILRVCSSFPALI